MVEITAKDLADHLRDMMDSLDDSVTREQIHQQLKFAWEAAEKLADAVQATFTPPADEADVKGDWVCAKCGKSSFEHSLTTSMCVWEPRWSGPVTDARVEAAAQAMFEDGTGLPGDYTWAQMVAEDPSRADIWRADARRVLEAAEAVQP